MRGNSHINAPVEIPKLLGKVSTAIDSSSHGDSPLGEFIIAEILFL